MKDVIERLKQQIEEIAQEAKAGEWISAGERLPEIEEPVLILSGNDWDHRYNRIETGRRVKTNEDGSWCWYGYAFNTMHTHVTRWMPLP
jgi:hypothetical protein